MIEEISEAVLHFPRNRCKVCNHRFPDVNVAQPNLDSELAAHSIGHLREYVRALHDVIANRQRHDHDPLMELAMQNLDEKFGRMFR
jgi:hypothetical protein